MTNIINEIKTYISDNKLTDEDIRSIWLKPADSQSAGEEESDAAEESPAEEEEEDEEESETPNGSLNMDDLVEKMSSLMDKKLDERFKGLKRGKKPPKKTKAKKGSKPNVGMGSDDWGALA
jgi:hypothetical protein